MSPEEMKQHFKQVIHDAFKNGFSVGYNQPECLIDPAKEATEQADAYVDLLLGDEG